MNIPDKFKGEEVLQYNYLYHAAGKIWCIPEVRLKKDPDDKLSISLEEISNLHKAILNEICGNSKPLTGGELEFLCDATDTKYSDVAKKFHVSKGNVSHWISAISPLSF